MRPAYTALLALFLLTSCIVAKADTALILHAQDSRVTLEGHWEYVKDPDLAITAEIAHGLPQSEYRRIENEMPNFGFTSARYWFRVPLQRAEGDDQRWVLEVRYPPLDHIGAYLIDTSGDVLLAEIGGDAMPFASRPIKNRHFTVLLPLPPDEPVWLYLSVQTQGSMQLPAVLFTTTRFVADIRDEQYVLGLYYGVLLALLIYNLLTYIAIRDSSYLYYLLYIGGFAIFQLTLNGLAFEYLWPNQPGWNSRALPITIFLSMAALVLLTRVFLRTRLTLPRLDMIQRVALGILALGAVAAIFAPYHIAIQWATGSAVLVPFLVFTAGLNSLVRGYREARFFLMAFTILLIGVAMYALKTFHFLPRNLVTEYSLQIGSSLQMILLSFALADRVRMLKQQAVNVDREARALLEQRVAARTSELDSALTELEGKNRMLSELNTTDGLTGVRNRVYMDQMLALEWPRAFRQQVPLSVLMLDLDHFKVINDTAGHQAGDEVLRQVARIIQKCVKRPCDIVCRYGGEEFLVILPDTFAQGAHRLAESVRQAIANTPIQVQGQTLHLTVSIGVAGTVPQSADEEAMSALIKSADCALYDAKSKGRNRVELGMLASTA
jgi:diguanylate cyclase (GGDEF)-like protein